MMSTEKYSGEQITRLTDDFLRDGFCVLHDHFSKEDLAKWSDAFQPLLDAHVAEEGAMENRGARRFYVTLPFVAPFADKNLYEDDAILAIVENIVGENFVCCQLATDTPFKGSDYQEIHSDTPPLFPEVTDFVTPSFQLAVNFPLVDVTTENGPFEVARGTHLLTKEEGMRRLETGEARLEPLMLKLGDVMIRDVRGLHRGTPNRTDTPRPMVVIGYSRRWLHRPEVHIVIPRREWERLSARARRMMRFNPIVESIEATAKAPEVYQSFAY